MLKSRHGAVVNNLFTTASSYAIENQRWVNDRCVLCNNNRSLHAIFSTSESSWNVARARNNGISCEILFHPPSGRVEEVWGRTKDYRFFFFFFNEIADVIEMLCIHRVNFIRIHCMQILRRYIYIWIWKWSLFFISIRRCSRPNFKLSSFSTLQFSRSFYSVFIESVPPLFIWMQVGRHDGKEGSFRRH